MTDYGTTCDLYRCLTCGHIGPALITAVTQQRHPYGDGYATETLIEDVECAECGSPDEMLEEFSDWIDHD